MSENEDWTWEEKPIRPEPLRLRWLLGGLLLAGMVVVGWWYDPHGGDRTQMVDELRAELYPQVWLEVQQDLQDDLKKYGIDTVIYGPVSIVGDGVTISHSLIWSTRAEPAIIIKSGKNHRVDTIKVQAENTRKTYVTIAQAESSHHGPEDAIVLPWQGDAHFRNFRLFPSPPFGSLTLREVAALRDACREVQPGQSVRFHLPAGVALDWGKFTAWCYEE